MPQYFTYLLGQQVLFIDLFLFQELSYLGDRVARYFGLSRESCILKRTMG